MLLMLQLRRSHVARLLVLGLFVLAAVSAPGRAQPTRPFAQNALVDLEAAVGSPVRATVSAKTGLVTFLSLAEHQRTLGKLPAEAPAEARAREFLGGYGAAFGVVDAESLVVTRVDQPDEIGMEHVRFRQMHQGVPVTGGELTVHLRGSNVVAVNAKTVAGLDSVATRPVVTATEASALAAEALARDLGVTDAELSAPRLELFNKGHLGGRGFSTGLTWFIEAKKVDLREFIWIDAIAGKLVLRFSQLTDALDREVHDADDPGDSVYDDLSPNLVRDEGDPATSDADVDAAYDYAGDTYDHFMTEHGRDSYDDAGASLLSWVHFCPSSGVCPYQNAFWNGVQMVYGEGFSAADDVVGHELTHAVTEHTANLFYYMQSGALNESFSDIFGETVDQTNGAGTDAPNNPRTAGNCSTYFSDLGGTDDSYRWLMGEDVPGFGAIRDMWDPTCFGDPGKMSETPEFYCDDAGDDAGGVHFNSGVPNHAYALMVDGGTYNFTTVTGIGITKAAKIQYRALAHYLTSASDFLDNYNAVKQSCQDLIGTAGIIAADCDEVGEALDAVEMSSPWPCEPAQASVPDLCPMGQIPTVVAYTMDAESGTSTLAPLPMACPSTAPTSMSPSNWCVNDPSSYLGAYATSGTQSFWGYNRPVEGSMTLSDTTQVLLPGGAKMQFNHSFGFENTDDTYWDGGVLEYSTDDGATWIDAGSLISSGQPYGGVVNDCCMSMNPLAGRMAFVGETWGYTATQLDLSSLAGQNLRYRFHIGTDDIIDDYGWFVDDIQIYSCCVPNRMLDSTYNGLATFYGASVSVVAGSGFAVGAGQTLRLQAPLVRIENGFTVLGALTITNATCP